jgi:DNA-binding IclR family transcriptional regulator
MTVQSIDRVFDIIELLSREQNGLQLTEIGRRLDLHKSTVYRLLSVLRKRGYIEKGDNNRYRIGVQFIELSSMYLNNIELKTEAEPYLRKLSQETRQTVFLAMIQDREVVYLDKFEQFNSIRKYSIIGRRRPLYCTSLGKAMLMDMSDGDLGKLFEGIHIQKHTIKTKADLPSLLEDLRKSRARGWSFDDEEYELGENCVGAPLHDYRGAVIAAISVAWKKDPAIGPEDYAALVSATARDISKRLGYTGKIQP